MSLLEKARLLSHSHGETASDVAKALGMSESEYTIRLGMDGASDAPFVVALGAHFGIEGEKLVKLPITALPLMQTASIAPARLFSDFYWRAFSWTTVLLPLACSFFLLAIFGGYMVTYKGGELEFAATTMGLFGMSFLIAAMVYPVARYFVFRPRDDMPYVLTVFSDRLEKTCGHGERSVTMVYPLGALQETGEDNLQFMLWFANSKRPLLMGKSGLSSAGVAYLRSSFTGDTDHYCFYSIPTPEVLGFGRGFLAGRASAGARFAQILVAIALCGLSLSLGLSFFVLPPLLGGADAEPSLAALALGFVPGLAVSLIGLCLFVWLYLFGKARHFGMWIACGLLSAVALSAVVFMALGL